MKLIYKNGDILKATENIICHQTNCQGIMGGGLALQIRETYPNVFVPYENFCEQHDFNYEKLNGQIQLLKISNENKYIANCFSQRANYDTDYNAIEKCFEQIIKFAKKEKMTICAPFNYGCGIANGNWDIVKNIFETLSKKHRINIVIYKF